MSDRSLVFDLPVVPVEHLHERLSMEKPVVQPPSSRAKVRTLNLFEGEREGEGRRRYSRTYTRRRGPIAQAGGLVLWHDFCPIPEVLAASPSIVGPVETVRDH